MMSDLCSDHHAPRGDREVLHAAVSDLARLAEAEGEPLTEDFRAELLNRLEAAARVYNEQAAARDVMATRKSDVVDRLERIKRACFELADAFEEAGPAEHNALHGYGPFLLIGGKVENPGDLAQLYDLVRRYDIPLVSCDGNSELRDLLRTPGAVAGIRHRDEPLSWPVAVRALGMIVQQRAQALDRSYYGERDRYREIVDAGPRATFPPAPRRRKPSADAIPKRLHNEQADRGGKESLLDDFEGHPKWVLVLACWDVMASILGELSDKISGSIDSPLAQLARCVYDYATGEDPEAGAGSRGLNNWVQKAVKVQGARMALCDRFGLDGLSEVERERLTSLDFALRTGRIPAWL